MRRNSGFTLIELMVAIAVLAILVTVVVPGMREFVQNNRIAATSNNFLSALALARAESLRRGAIITVCHSSDEATCGGDWQDGWIMFVDGSPPGDPPTVGELVRVGETMSGGATLAGPDYVRYLPSGRVDTAAPLDFSLRIPDCRGDQARDIRVIPTGRAAVGRVACP